MSFLNHVLNELVSFLNTILDRTNLLQTNHSLRSHSTENLNNNKKGDHGLE